MKLLISVLALAAVCLGQNLELPSLLSRGLAPAFRSSSRPAVFNSYIGLGSGFDSGPLTTRLDRGDGPFQQLDGGLVAHRAAKRSSFDLDYQFGLRHYPTSSRLDNSTHGLSLDARFRLSRRWTVLLRDVGSSSSFANSVLSLAAGPPAGFISDGGPEVFHSRTVVNTVLGDLVFSPTLRTSISVAGDGFVIQRQYRGLADVLGWRSRGDVAHRYARNKTITASYSFTHFDFSRAFGGADYAVYAVGHSLRLGKRSEFDLLAGAGRLRSAGIRAVELDREIAQLLGTSRGAEIYRLDTWTPHLLASWTQGLHRAEFRVQLSRLVSDGGGLSGLARQNQATLTLAAPFGRSWRLAGNVSGRRHRSLDTLLYDSITAMSGVNLSRRLGGHTEAVLRYSYSFYNFDQGLLHEFHRHQVGVGVVYHFREAPARL